MPPSRAQTRIRSPSQGTASTSNKRIRARLTPTTLSVSSTRVRKTWRPLPTPTQDRIRNLLLSISAASQSTHLAHTSRSRRNNTNTTNPAKVPGLTPDDHAEAITALTQKLLTRLPKMQFPPSSSNKTARSHSTSAAASAAPQETDFDYEATLTSTSTLSAQLADANQSAKLLRASIKQEEADLRRERAELVNLQENYRRSVAAQRDLERGLHAVVRGFGGGLGQGQSVKREIKAEDDDDEYGQEGEGIADATLGSARRRIRRRTKRMGGLDGNGGGGEARLLSESAIDGDEDLKALAKQLRSHLGSMAGNTAGMKGVASELRGVEAAVAAFAWKGMSREKYERVVGLR